MKLVSTVICLSLLAGFVHAASQDGTKIQEKAGHRVRLIYYVTGLSGETEAGEVVQALKRLPTLTTASVNLQRGYVKVSFDSHDMSYHQVAQAVADVGATHGKQYDPRVVFTVPDYANPAIRPKIQAILADENLRQWIRINPIDEAKGIFFVHFLALVPDPKKIGTQGFNGGYLTHPIHMAPPIGMALPFKYLSEDSPEIPVGARTP